VNLWNAPNSSIWVLKSDLLLSTNHYWVNQPLCI
jgi:hypothetical protein